MKVSTFFKRFKDESGAVTVDWTVLAAAVVGLGIASAAAVRTGTSNLGGDIDSALSGASVAALGTLGSTELVQEAWTPLYFSQELQDANTAYFAGETQDSLDSSYASYQQSFDYYMNVGNTEYAGAYLDLMSSTIDGGAVNNLTPAGSDSFATSYQAYQDAVNPT